MTYGLIGASPNQVISNSGIYDIADATNINSLGFWGGAWEQIATTDISSNTNVDFTSLGSYKIHMIQALNIQGTSATAQDLLFQFSNDGGSSFISSGYQYSARDVRSDGTNSQVSSGSFSSAMFAPDLDSESLSRINGYALFYDLVASDLGSYSTFTSCLFQSAVNTRTRFGGSYLNVAETHNAIRVLTGAGGGMAQGKLTLYGFNSNE